MSKFSTSVKNGFSKMTGALSLRESVTPVADPIALSVPTKLSPEFHTAVARMAEENNDSVKAERHYREALRLAPKNLEATMSYAHMLDRESRLAEATDLYRRAVELQPDNSATYNDLGICYARRNMFPESVQAMEQAVRLQPRHIRYRNNLAKVLVELNRVDDAFNHLRAVHSEDAAYYNLAYLLKDTGNTEGAARLFAQALVKNPQLTEARLWLDRLGGPPPASARQPQSIAQRPAPRPTANQRLAPNPPASRPMALQPAQNQPPLPPTPTPNAGKAPGNPGMAPLPSLKPLPPVTRGR